MSVLSQRFPGLGGAAGASHVEALGVFVAKTWGSLASRQAGIPPGLVQSLGSYAGQVAQARKGGTTLLCHLRSKLGDAAFLASVGVLAPLYMRARQSGTTQRAPAPAPGGSSAAQRVEIAGFEVREELGAGNMGRVYKARQKSLDRMVALKVLFRSLAEEDETYVARFEREARAAAKLQHPNIVMVIDAGICPRTGVQFIAMELVDGQSLGEIQAERKTLTVAEALTIAFALTQALDCAEKNGIVHRDLKPDNVLVGSDGIPRLVDLGLAKKREAKDLTGAGIVVGTPIYMAPEQAMALSEVDGRADIYSLGLTLFHLVTGEVPLQAETAMGVLTRHINEDVPDPRTIDPSLSPAFSKLIAGLCARDLDKRYPTALAAAGVIERLLSGQSPLGPEAADRAQRASRGSSTFRVGALSGTLSGISALGPARPELTPPAGLSPAAQVLWRFEQSGFPGFLTELAELVEGPAAKGEVDALAFRARGAIWEADSETAVRSARALIEVQPESAAALEVLSAVGRGEPALALFRGALLQPARLTQKERYADARSIATELQRAHPSEPHPHLIRALLGTRTQEEAAVHQALQLAWALFPSRAHARVTLGAGLDLFAAEALIDRGRQALEGDDPAERARTVTDTDDKSNLVAGALRMGIGLVFTWLAEFGEHEQSEVRRAFRALARGLGGLQYFSHALELIAQLERLEPTPGELSWIEEEKRLIAGFKSVTQPGIQPKRGRYACPVVAACAAGIRLRLQGIATQVAESESELEAAPKRLAELVQVDPSARREVEAAAQSLGREDPFAALDEADRELAEVGAAMTDLDSPEAAPAKGKTGFFNRLKVAANTAGRAAKAGHLKLRHSQATSRRAKAETSLGEELTGELAQAGYTHPELAPSAHANRKLQAALEHVRREDAELRVRLGWLGA
ncbi:MAG: serine/threonine protein kinase [Planctomycetes bacterium]|nr:serine/threonine protein kinase [Planctomycetota bacterium]